jgi:protein O-GlcNAc transferase
MKHRSSRRRERKPLRHPQPRSQDLSSPAPFDVATTFSQAMASHRAGRIAEAEAGYRRILAAQPDHFDSLHLLGVVHHQRGDHVEAVRLIDAALQLNPNSASAHSNRGSALQALGDLEPALASYDKALALRPNLAEVLFNRGNVLQSLTRLDAALESFDAALTIRPDYADALVNRGGVLQELERLPEALASYDKALAASPDCAQALNNQGTTLKGLGRLDEALSSYERAIALQPDYAEAFYNRAIVLREMNRFQDSISDYDRAIALKLGDRYLKGARLHAKMLICDWSSLDEDVSQLTSAIGNGIPASLPFPFLAVPASPAAQRRCAELYVADKFHHVSAPLWRGERYCHDRIRLAYLSADMHDHAVPQLTAGLFESHDRTRFETIAISLAPCRQDRMYARLRTSFDRFFDVAAAKNHEVAALVRELEVDIAVDLNGFTKGARPGIFVKRPAPVQVNYLGYAGTLGSCHWDYIIADRFAIPEDCHEHYGEKVAYLPASYLPNDPARNICAHTPSRADAGLPDHGVVFCCFNNAYKITPDVFDVWMRLLRAVEGSVLWLSGANPGAVENLRVEAAKRGVAPERLVFAAKIPSMEQHLARHRLADLLLDTLYYNAHTTAIDALWAGLPVLTCSGTTFASRGAGSLLTAVGLSELITHSLADYEALALRLARDGALLSGIKQKLARNRTTHPLFDAARFTRDIEAAYVTMWERSQRGEPPTSFSVAAVD